MEMPSEDRITRINIEQEMQSAYIDYSMSVIVSRALPDARDGLKPVQRRVLFGMDKMGNNSNKPHKKSANCVGEVMGKYHPHGDSSIYGTVVRLAQEWNMRYCLVDGHGCFGSVDGDAPAAMRYTEVRLDRMGEEMLRDLDSDTVEMVRTYDNEREEPSVLPTRFPNLLVNGAAGIAVGMATNMAPHNLTESINASIALLENPDITIDELMNYIVAPDFPTGGIIYGYNGVKEAYRTGKGRIIIRATTSVESDGNHESIIVTEIPFGVNKSELIKYIADLVIDKKIDGIADINDESDFEGMRIVIKLKQDANSQVVLNKLFKLSQLQYSFSINNMALVHGRPRLLNLKELLQSFIDHRHDVVIRRTKFELEKAQERAHILEGMIIASQNIDEVINIIRHSEDTESARKKLTERFGLSDKQTQAIVEMRLRQLTGLEQTKLQDTYNEVQAEIARLELILTDDSVCRQVIKDELIEVREKYGDERRTRIDYTAGDFNPEDFYADDEMIITISHIGYIKRTPLSEFTAQRRGGIGVRGSQTREEDFIEYIYPASMHNDLLFFTQKGMYYRLKVYDIPEGTRTSKGRAIQNLLKIDPDDSINAVIKTKGINDQEFAENHNLVFATRKGIVKKTSLKHYVNAPLKGKKALVIREDDDLMGVCLTDGKSEIILASRNGRCVRFDEEKHLRPMGRITAGVVGMRLDNDGEDHVVSLVCMEQDDTNTLLTVSTNGYGKRSILEDFRKTSRGAKGVKALKVTEKTGHLVALKSVNDDNDLVIINKSGITIRLRVADVKICGRNTQGVRLINLDKRDDEIASVCVVPTDPEEETEVVDNTEVIIDENPDATDDADDADADAVADDVDEEAVDVEETEETEDDSDEAEAEDIDEAEHSEEENSGDTI